VQGEVLGDEKNVSGIASIAQATNRWMGGEGGEGGWGGISEFCEMKKSPHVRS